MSRLPVRVRRAQLRDGAKLAALYRDRRRWLLSRDNRQWRDERFTAAAVRSDIRRRPVFVATWRGLVVGAVRVAWRDPMFWPDRPAADAAYVGGLVVARRVAGRGVSEQLLAAAGRLARARRRHRLRLDCAPLPAMDRLYRRLGFRLVDESSLGGYRVFRFERAA